MKVSIAMATYNGAKYLPEQLQSFIDQTHQPDEVVITDDCSTDNTVQICQKFANDAPFKVEVIRNENNLGYNKNFGNALNHCTGDIIFISDQDDVWFSNKIEKIVQCFQNNPSIYLVIHDLEYCDEYLKPIGQTKIDRISIFGNPMESYVTGMATAIKSDLKEICLPIPHSDIFNYDNWIHKCSYILKKKLIFDKTLAFYRRHNDNATNTSNLNVPFKTNKFFYIHQRWKNGMKYSVNSDLQNLIENLDKKIKCILKLQEKIDVDCYQHRKNIEYYICQLNTEKDIVNERIELRQHNSVERIKSAFKFYVKGGYKSFSGFNSLLKDLLFVEENI